MNNFPTDFKPISQDSRIHAIDALRGFALLGVLLANLPVSDNPVTTLTIDEPMGLLYYLFIEKKFMTIFSILFGFGFYIQMKRAEKKDINFNKYFLKRMVLLFAIGTVHAWLFWNGDILRAYALGGILLLLLRKSSIKKMLAGALVSIILLTGILFIVNSALGWRYGFGYEYALEIFTATSFVKYLEINFITDPWVNFLIDMPLTIAFAFGNMLLGVVLGRIGFFEMSKETQKLRSWLVVLGITLGVGASFVYFMVVTGKLELDIPLLWLPFVVVAGMLAQSLSYIALFVWLYSKNQSKRLLNFFKPVGHTALTNYLMQSLFMIIIFYHCTNLFSYYGQFGTTMTFATGTVIFILQSIISRIWLERFDQGPIEQLWRRWSYGQQTK
ncbi:MAG: DUF418 domain-containing protein [Cyclobacteriaceae bacterium]